MIFSGYFGDLDFQRHGLAVTLRRTKTDQEARGCRVGIPFGSTEQTCPVRASAGSRPPRSPAAPSSVPSTAMTMSVVRGFRTARSHAWLRSTPHSSAWTPSAMPVNSLRAGPATSAADGGAFGPRDHAPDLPPLAGDGKPLRARGLAVPRQRRDSRRALAKLQTPETRTTKRRLLTDTRVGGRVRLRRRS